MLLGMRLRTGTKETCVYLSGSPKLKNQHQKDTCLKRLDILAQNMLTILRSIVNMVGGGRGRGEV